MEWSEEAAPRGIRDGGKCWGPLSPRSDRGRPPPGLTRGAAAQPGRRRRVANAVAWCSSGAGPRLHGATSREIGRGRGRQRRGGGGGGGVSA